MGIRLLLYVLVSGLTLYCFFIYEDPVLSGLLAAEGLCLILVLVQVLVLWKKIQPSLLPVLPLAEKNQKIPVKMKIQNRSRMPVFRFRIRLTAENQFTGEKQKLFTGGSLKPKEEKIISLGLAAGECGSIRIRLEKVEVYDCLSLLKLSWRENQSRKAGILPKCHILPLEITRRTREFVADAEEYSDRESGKDPAEIYQIREYREQDSLHDIHWKLSAKEEELLVKEHGKPLGCAVLLWIDLEKTGGRKREKQKHPSASLLEAAASLSLSLLEEKCVHMAAWYEKENHRVVKKRIGREEHIYEFLNRILYAELYDSREEAGQLREEAFRGIVFSTVVEFGLTGTVTVNGEIQARIPPSPGEEDWNQMLLTV